MSGNHDEPLTVINLNTVSPPWRRGPFWRWAWRRWRLRRLFRGAQVVRFDADGNPVTTPLKRRGR